MKNRRRLILVPLAAAAVTLVFASMAYACTLVVGSITPSPASGSTVNVGQTVTLTGNNLDDPQGSATTGGAPNGTQWSLYFLQHKSYQDGMKTCMGQGVGPTTEQKIGTTSPAQAGNSVTVSGPIPNKKTADPAPLGPTLGPALVCLLSENPATNKPNYSYATPSAEYTVV